MDNGPTYEQIKHLGHWLHEMTSRVTDSLSRRQQAGPTRISGMSEELDRAAEDAIREWCEELKRDWPPTG